MKDWRELSLFPPVLSSLKLPVGWLDFLRKSPCCLGCGAQERCVRPDTKKAIYRPYLCVTSDVFWLRMSHVGCANRLGKKKKKGKKRFQYQFRQVSIPIAAGFQYLSRQKIEEPMLYFYRMYNMVDRLNRQETSNSNMNGFLFRQ